MAVQSRGRSGDALKDFLIPFPISCNSAIPQETKLLTIPCCMWATLAFLFGVFVGVTLPYIVDNNKQDFIYNKDLNDTSNKRWTLADAPSKTISFIKIVNPKSLSEVDNNLDQHSSLDISKNDILENKIQFGTLVEDALPKGFSEADIEDWRKFIQNQTVVRLHEGCGRMQNRLLTFASGTQSCCRYRQNIDQIQGEIFSFYLSRILEINNVPPAALGVVKSGSKQWGRVDNQLALAQWSEDHPVVLTKFITNLDSVSIPTHFRSSSRKLHPIDIENSSANMEELIELAQWSDLIIFDYLTANLDRIVNNLYNLQWNPSMMEAPAHNLAKQITSNLLVFLDNESGLLHGYRLLDKYEPYHQTLLQSLCVFRKSTVDNIKELVSKKDVGKKLNRMLKIHEPHMLNYLPTLPEKTIQVLNERLKRVYKQIQKCKNLHIRP